MYLLLDVRDAATSYPPARRQSLDTLPTRICLHRKKTFCICLTLNGFEEGSIRHFRLCFMHIINPTLHVELSLFKNSFEAITRTFCSAVFFCIQVNTFIVKIIYKLQE